MSGSLNRLNCEILQSDSVPWILGSVSYLGSCPSLGKGCLGVMRRDSLTSWVRADGFVDCLDSDLGEALF